VHRALFVAVGVAAGSATVAFLISRHIRPVMATRVITMLAVVSAVSTLWTLLLVASSNIVQLHGVAERLSWCSNLLVTHRGTISPVGAGAIVALGATVFSALRVFLRQRRLRAPMGQAGLAIVPSDVPNAFALPGHLGHHGQVVVSTGMLRSLEPDERRALLAHERAHLRCHHHRFVRLTQLAGAAVPLLMPLYRRVRYATERWADEEAVREVGSRAVVARAIARAALAQTAAMDVALGMADTGVVERVESLLNEVPRPSRCFEIGAISAVLVAIGGLATSLVLVEPWAADLLGLCH
jgi:Zn-dependent protease with chaperone function